MKISNYKMDQWFRRIRFVEKQPSPDVRDRIEQVLDSQKPERSIMPFWRWGVAASILLAVGVFLMIERPQFLAEDLSEPAAQNETREDVVSISESDKNEVSVQDAYPHNTTSDISVGRSEADIVKNERAAHFSNLLNESAKSELVAENASDDTVLLNRNEEMHQKLAAIPIHEISNIETNPVAEYLVHQNAKGVDEFASLNTSAEEDPKSVFSRLTIGGEYSPTYAFREASGGTSGDNPERGLRASGAGFNMSLDVNSRWQVETGVKYAVVGQEVTLMPGPEMGLQLVGSESGRKFERSDLELNNTMGDISSSVASDNSVDLSILKTPVSEGSNLQSWNIHETEKPLLEQSLGYVQIPFTVRYKLLNQQSVDVFISGGLSTNLLVDNNAYLELLGQKQRIGHTDGLASTSFSTHAGIAMGVSVYRNFKLRMEPRVNYFISDISQSSLVDFRPYSFGVFTGVFYEF